MKLEWNSNETRCRSDSNETPPAFPQTAGHLFSHSVEHRLIALVLSHCVPTGVCEKKTPFTRALALQNQQQKLLSSHWFGTLKACLPTCVFLRRKILFTDTGTSPIKGVSARRNKPTTWLVRYCGLSCQQWNKQPESLQDISGFYFSIEIKHRRACEILRTLVSTLN